jgi:hypothetical protein
MGGTGVGGAGVGGAGVGGAGVGGAVTVIATLVSQVAPSFPQV